MACPRLKVPVPMTVAPSRNCTVPVGVPVPVTAAVKVTLCPAVDGFAEELTDVLLALLPTVCVSTAEVLGRKVPSPRYAAVIECEPGANVEIDSVACCPMSSVPVPITVMPSRKVTVPAGVPGEALLTVAVRTTA